MSSGYWSGRVCGEVPDLVLGEALRLGMHAERVVPGDDHVLRGVAPGCRLFEVGAELGGMARMTRDGVGRGAEVLLRHEVRVDVVVGERAVLVGARDAVDAEASLRVVVAERAPESRGLHEELEADLALEVVVVRRPPGSATTASAIPAPMWKAAVPAGQ